MSKGRFFRIVAVIAFWVCLGTAGWRWIAEVLEADEEAAPKAQTVYDAITERIPHGTATRQKVEEIVRRTKPDHMHGGFEASYYYWDAPFRSCLVIVEYGAMASAKQEPVRSPKTSGQHSPDDQATSVAIRWVPHPENSVSIPLRIGRFVRSPQVFLIPLPLLMLWAISRLIRSEPWRAGLKPFWFPAGLWIAYGVCAVYVLGDGIRVDLVLIPPLLLLITLGAFAVASWRLVRPYPANRPADRRSD